MAQTHALSESDFRAWKKQGKEVKFRPCFEVEQTILHSTFCEKSKQWLTARSKLDMDSLSEAKNVARDEARKHGTGSYRVHAVVDGTMVETPTYVKGDVKVEDRVQELEEEFGVSESVVWALYDMMPNELYDGIPSALEDAQCDSSYDGLLED